MHADDVQALADLRERLCQVRRVAGVSGPQVSGQLGRSKDFVSSLERGLSSNPMMSSLQGWAGGLGMRIEFEVDDLWMFTHTASNMVSLHAASRPWGADAQQRLWLVSALRTWRMKRGIDVEVLAPLLETSADAVRDWEDSANDPLIGRAMWQARVTGTAVRMRLWPKADWVFG